MKLSFKKKNFVKRREKRNEGLLVRIAIASLCHVSKIKVCYPLTVSRYDILYSNSIVNICKHLTNFYWKSRNQYFYHIYTRRL